MSIEQDAARWQYMQQEGYFQTGPYSTDGDFYGYSVGIEPNIPTGIHWKERAKYGGLNSWIKGRGETLAEALDKALASD